MQAPRNWRMKEQRYQLAVTKSEDGTSTIVNRPQSLASQTSETDTTESEIVKANAA